MKNKTLIIILLATIVAGFLIWSSYKKKPDCEQNGKTNIILQLQWFDGAQFCGVYVAKKKGYFREEGINLTINPLPSFTSDPVAILTDGNADIAIATADQVLINKDKGKEIKAFGTVFNRSLACYSYLKNFINGDSIKIMNHKKIAVYKKFDTENILLALIKKNDLQIEVENIIQAPKASIDALQFQEIDFLGSYLINEPIKMRIAKQNVGVIDPELYGVRFYADTYIAKSSAWEGTEKINKEILAKFLRAVNRGWADCKKNPDEALDIMFSMINNKTKTDDLATEKPALLKAIQYVGDGPDKTPGYMDRDRWLSMEKDLFSIGRITQTGYIDDLCDFKLIEKINANK